jgi:predicted transcriptional regulator
MTLPRFSPLENRIMEVFWSGGPRAIREVQESFPEAERPAYTTVQTMVYRLEAKRALRRVKKISNAHIFEAVVSRASAQRHVIDELLGLFGGRAQPVIAHMIDAGGLTMDDVREAERRLKQLEQSKKGEG